jgi:hypothetical protein
MSINLTSILQNITGLNSFFAGPAASRQAGVVLEDSATVTWTTDGQGNVQATAAGGAPSGAANLVEATPNGSSGAATLRALVPADLPVGSSTQKGAVEVDGTTITATAGVISVAAPAGMVLIQNQTLVAPAATVTFSAIPQTYTSLMLLIGTVNTAGSPQEFFVSFNGDAGANYSSLSITNTAGTITGGDINAQTATFIGIAHNSGISIMRATIPFYATALTKAVETTYQAVNPGFNSYNGSAGGAWNSTAAITSLVLALASGNFATGSVFSLYGLA